jgi:phosphatidylserine/phosphatidylglycerophosphate/cardiolipin synthase-like enzyme
MNEIIQLIQDSISDNVLVTSEKKQIQYLIREKGFDKRELDILRSEIFKIARAHQNQIPVSNLIDWIEKTTKLTLAEKQNPKEYSHAFFSPGSACKNAIIHHLKHAKNTVEICVFTISDNNITHQILATHKRGIHVKIITDDDKINDLGSDIRELHNSGIPVKVDGTRSLMHNKFCIIDKQLIITGSYNWTNSAANRNFENILVNNDAKVVKSYQQEFEHLWERLEKF